MEVIQNLAHHFGTSAHEDHCCDFCPITFETILERDEHILSHVKREICRKCDQNLIRFGGNWYVLHATVTCVERNVDTETMDNDQHDEIQQQTDTSIDEDEDKQCIDMDVGQYQFGVKLEIDAEKDIEESNPLRFTEDDILTQSHIKHETDVTNQTESVDSFDCQSGFQCEICMKEMRTKTELEKHIKRIHYPSIKQFKCKNCEMAFATNYELKQHNRKEPKMCTHCKQTFCSSSSLRAHRVECSSKLKKDQDETMQIKDQPQTKPQTKPQYTKCDSNEKPECNICLKTFARRGHLLTHQRRVHEKNTRHKCEKCEQAFGYAPELDRHKENLIVCNKCGDSFCAKTLLISHQSEYCNLMNKDEIGDRQCKLEGCNEIVAVNTWFNHMITKHNDIFKSFKCDICQKLFKQKFSLSNHMLMIHCPNRRKFQCDLCEYKCVRKSMIKHHKKYTHSKERNFVCSQCGKRFKKKHNLLVHMNTHTGEKPFECLQCSKRFCDSSQRAEHMRMHTGVKPFLCTEDGCGKRFRYAVDVKRHKFSAHGIYHKKIPCSICNEIFPELVLLKRHMKKHETQL